ncbi:MAG: hypothetical protein JSV27_04415, partial [Candidatus Bathyarchaeota archaeon]
IPAVVCFQRVVYPFDLGDFSIEPSRNISGARQVPEMGPASAALVIVRPDLLDDPVPKFPDDGNSFLCVFTMFIVT